MAQRLRPLNDPRLRPATDDQTIADAESESLTGEVSRGGLAPRQALPMVDGIKDSDRRLRQGRPEMRIKLSARILMGLILFGATATWAGMVVRNVAGSGTSTYHGKLLIVTTTAPFVTEVGKAIVTDVAASPDESPDMIDDCEMRSLRWRSSLPSGTAGQVTIATQWFGTEPDAVLSAKFDVPGEYVITVLCDAESTNGSHLSGSREIRVVVKAPALEGSRTVDSSKDSG